VSERAGGPDESACSFFGVGKPKYNRLLLTKTEKNSICMKNSTPARLIKDFFQKK
jgi:hypothetical protein